MSVPGASDLPGSGLKKAPSRAEFIALIAMLFAIIAFSIDAMLPALPRIGAELSPDAPNRAQLIVIAFVLGMGAATLFAGPMSDALGRKPMVIGGTALYIVGAALAWFAPTLEWLLLARVLQGVGAAGPRVVGMAIVRDLYGGREMARILSFVMMVFMLVPAIAPLVGSWIIAAAGWRAMFGAFVIFAGIATLWLALRLPESLPPAARRPMRLPAIASAVGEVLTHPVVRLSIMAQTMGYVLLFTSISLIQPVFDQVFDRGAQFPLWFAGMAIVSGSASVINAALVMRLGMQRLAMAAFGAQVILSAAMTLCWLAGLRGEAMFAVYLVWQCTVLFQSGLTVGNLNAIAMEPMAHIAGTAASVIGAVATIAGALIAAPIALVFNATPLPMSLGVGGASAVAFVLLWRLGRIERRVRRFGPVDPVK
ncbi:multidrug effflux MFS transporter [Seohaeicola saemankumensis]|uniref:multidrug effflux MFS transporter n=1 Tax=Seohaeicola TaxID=481178 RepID=UPI0007F42ED2|nr:multidrug MFS transporter [Rhodobacteraceae bacterium EhC02]